jgi:hypothetical protein
VWGTALVRRGLRRRERPFEPGRLLCLVAVRTGLHFQVGVKCDLTSALILVGVSRSFLGSWHTSLASLIAVASFIVSVWTLRLTVSAVETAEDALEQQVLLNETQLEVNEQQLQDYTRRYARQVTWYITIPNGIATIYIRNQSSLPLQGVGFVEGDVSATVFLSLPDVRECTVVSFVKWPIDQIICSLIRVGGTIGS